jgi:hypothetical protein
LCAKPVYNFAKQTNSGNNSVKSRWKYIFSGLALWLAAGVVFAGPPTGNIDEMRAWLGQRNIERKQLGLPGADITLKKHFGPARTRPLAPHSAAPKPLELAPAELQAQIPAHQGTPVLHIGRGPDGRIHHRLVFKEDGPDQLQVFVPSGYGPTPSDEAGKLQAARLERLTPRGKRLWMAGAASRLPSQRLKPSAAVKIDEELQ